MRVRPRSRREIAAPAPARGGRHRVELTYDVTFAQIAHAKPETATFDSL